ncbi:MAG: glycosyltransferase, partial [Acidobacteriota bacterium]
MSDSSQFHSVSGPSPNTGSSCFLIFAIGTAGDVYPNLAIGKALRLRGSRVVVAANSYFESAVRRAGVGFISMGEVDEYLRVTADPELWQWGKGFRILLREMIGQMKPVYDTIVRHAAANDTVVIAPASALGARLANEKLNIPLVSLYLQPMALRTWEEQPGVTLPRYLKPLVRPLRTMLLTALDRWLLHPRLLPGLNAFRSELNLAPVENVFDSWIHSPRMVLGLFPEWFAARQPDWPAQFRQT